MRCWDFAKDFVYKYKEFIEAGFDEDPFIIYHWTEEKNFGSILDNNLKVPDGRTVAVINGSAHGVGIYAHTEYLPYVPIFKEFLLYILSKNSAFPVRS